MPCCLCVAAPQFKQLAETLAKAREEQGDSGDILLGVMENFKNKRVRRCLALPAASVSAAKLVLLVPTCTLPCV